MWLSLQNPGTFTLPLPLPQFPVFLREHCCISVFWPRGGRLSQSALPRVSTDGCSSGKQHRQISENVHTHLHKCHSSRSIFVKIEIIRASGHTRIRTSRDWVKKPQMISHRLRHNCCQAIKQLCLFADSGWFNVNIWNLKHRNLFQRDGSHCRL